MTNDEFREELARLLRAHFPLIHINSYEEDRVLQTVEAIARDLSRSVFVWSTSHGVFDPTKKEHGTIDDKLSMADLAGALETFEQFLGSEQSKKKGMIFILLDPGVYLTDHNANPIYARKLRDLAIKIRSEDHAASCLIISPSLAIPRELERDVTVLDYPLPSREEIGSYIDNVFIQLSHTPSVTVADGAALRADFAEAAVGLTFAEIKDAISYSVVDDLRVDDLDVQHVFRQKRQIVRKSGILDFVETHGLSLDHIGGLNRLKEWLLRRRVAFSPEGRKFGIQAPRGVLVTGVPGCGKSWSAKCISASWNLPLLKLDLGKVYSALIGSSEEHMRRVIQVAEGVAPCVLWIDEIEKGLQRPGSHIGDNGVSLRVLGTFLTWMQEKESGVFVFATANQIELLPSEILRKGRFDEIFFVDLPCERERRDILDIHIRRIGRVSNDIDLDRLVDLSGPATHGPDIVLSGAELAAWINEAVINAYHRRLEHGEEAPDLEFHDFEASAHSTVPLARLRADDIAALRQWAQGHAIPASTDVKDIAFRGGWRRSLVRGSQTLEMP